MLRKEGILGCADEWLRPPCYMGTVLTAACDSQTRTMSNFLLKEPDCVLIHIPKTGGSSIRHGIWADRYEGPTFGSIPPEWGSCFAFAFVRHPLDRLVSAYRDFSQYRGFKGSLASFFDIVSDESIIYDERRSTLAERIRHHAIPQTHPFNCLQLAAFVGRYERYAEDLADVLRRVGMDMPEDVPRHRETAGNTRPWSDFFSGRLLARATRYYSQDFEQLGYPLPPRRTLLQAARRLFSSRARGR